MPSDPWTIFKNDVGRQETLKILWPDLYDCLADLDKGGPPRVIRCVLGGYHGELPSAQRPPAVARIGDQYGPPACRECIDKVHGKGAAGWPLKRDRMARR